MKKHNPSWFSRQSGRSAAVLGTAAAGLVGALPGHVAAQGTRQAQTGAEATFTFDIAPGTLADVAAAYERTTGLTVVFTHADLGTLASPGVHQTTTASVAMSALLHGNAVTAEFSEGQVLLMVADLTEDVRVTAGAPTVSSPRYTVPLRDIAQTIALVPRDVIEQRAAFTLTDALRNIPGITLQAGEGGGSSNTAGDMFNMRGFSANNSLFVDNVRDSGLIARDMFNVEQVEVFMGPTGSDVGRGTAAGYVNMQTKRALAGTHVDVSGIGGSAAQGRVTADVNVAAPAGPSSPWLHRSAIRLNAVWQDRGVPGRDFVNNASRAVAPAVTLGLGTATRVFAHAQFMRQDNVPDYGVPAAAWLEAPLSPTTVRSAVPVRQANYYGSPAYDYDHAHQDAYLARVEHDVNRRLTLSSQIRVNTTEREAVVSTVTNNAAYVPATGMVTVTRQGNHRRNTITSSQTTAVGRFQTGPLRHGLSAGVELLRESQSAPGLQGLGTRAPVSLLAPNPHDAVADYAPSRSLADTDGRTDSAALYADDTVQVGERWLVGGGFRLDRYDTSFRAVDAEGATTTDLSARGTLFSGRSSVLFRLTDAANLYLSYGTTVTPPGEGNFQLSATANNVNNPNVDPQRSTNLELGGKADLGGGRLAVNGAVFRTRNRNVIYTVDAAAAPPIFNQDDDQLVRGMTAGVLGQINDRWRVLANAAYLSASLQSQGPNNGRRLTLTPAFSGSLWTTIRVAGGLSVGGGVQHVGSSFTNAANTIRIPAYALVDALVEYAVNRHLTLRVNLYNVTDAVYVRNISNNGGRYNPGNPRSVLVTSRLGF